MEDDKKVKDAVNELMDNLLTIGKFNATEVGAFFKRVQGASWSQMTDAVDKLSKSMKQSGKWAINDVERTAKQIHESIEWEKFLKSVRQQLENVSKVTQDVFETAVNRATTTFVETWQQQGKPGEEQIKVFQNKAKDMSEAFKKQWSTVEEQMQKTGSKIDRAMNAAWEELKKDEESGEK